MANITPLGGSAKNNSQKNLYTYIVDPNPSENKIIAPENYFIYANLKAITKSRSVIQTDGTFSNLGGSERVVSFIGTTTQNGYEYVTSNYTNIGANEGSEEAFGIEQIEINVKEKFVPEVNITFGDVRGGALMNGIYERRNVAGELELRSKFNAFFNLPYPIFTLEVKAEYGDMVSYCLHLRNYDIDYDANQGVFRIKATFIGFTYAFLSDILFKNVMALNSTVLGENNLKKYGSVDLETYMSGIGKLTSIGEQFKQSNGTFKELTLINTLIEEIINVQNFINKPSNLFRKSLFGAFLNEGKLKQNKDQLFIRDVGLIAENKSLQHRIVINDVERFSNKFNELITNNISSYSYLNAYKLNDFVIEDPILTSRINQNLVDKVNDLIKKYESNYNVNLKLGQLYSILNLSTKDVKQYSVFNYYKIRKNSEKILLELNDKKTELEKKVNEELNQQIVSQAGIDLSIQNMYKVLLDNTEAFLDTLYDVSVVADDENLQQRRLDSLGINLTDIPPSEQRIYPFPAVYNPDTDDKVWIGDLVGNNNSAFPELKLVDSVLNGLVAITNKQIQRQITQYQSQNATIKKGSHFPLNPKLSAPYGGMYKANNNNTLPLNFVEEVIGRYFVYEFISDYPAKSTKLFAGMEGAFAAATISNKQFVKYLDNIDAQSFWDKIKATLDNGVDNPFVNIFETSENFKIEQVLSTNSVKLNDNVVDFINTKNIDVNSSFIIPKDKLRITNLNSQYEAEMDYTGLLFKGSIRRRIGRYYKSTRNINVYKRRNSFTVTGILNDIAVFDGVNNIIDYASATPEERIKNISGDIIGKLFEKYYYYDITAFGAADKYTRAYTLLECFGIDFEYNVLTKWDSVSNIQLNKLQLLYLCSKMYENELIKNGGKPFAVQLYLNRTINPNDQEIYQFLSDRNKAFDNDLFQSDSFNETLSSYFKNWVDNEYEDFQSEIFDYVSMVRTNQHLQQGNISNAKKIISNVIKHYREIVRLKMFVGTPLANISIPEKLETILQNNTSATNMEIWCKSWFNGFKLFSNEVVKIQNGVDDLKVQGESQITYITDKDFKLDMYSHLKNIYDKWVGGNLDSKVYNACSYGKGVTSSLSLFDRFHFVDRTWSAVGDKSIANPKPLQVLSMKANINMYHLLHYIADENNFTYFSLPNYVDFSSIEGIKTMFEPKTSLNDNSSGASFVLMYVGGRTKTLNLSDKQFYVNDGFDFRQDGQFMPKGYTNRRLPLNYENLSDAEKNKYNLIAFRVAIGDQNQSFFTNLKVSQNQFRETNESINVTQELFGEKGRTKPFYKGQNLYNIYTLRSFETSVTMMGNMQIQPLMFYQLDNVAMFTGAYMIVGVNHNIVANKVTTSFTGLKMPRFAYPIVDSPTSFLNLSLNDTLYTKSFASQLFNLLDFEEALSGDGNDLISGAELSEFSTDNVDLIQNNDAIIQYRYMVDKWVERVDEFPTGEALYYLKKDVTSVAQLKGRIINNFPVGTTISNFGIKKSESCYAWVEVALRQIGIFRDFNLKNSGGLVNDTTVAEVVGRNAYANKSDSWVTPASIPTQLLKFLTPAQFKSHFGKTVNADTCKELGIPDGSIIFGYHAGSNWVNRAYDRYLFEFKNNPDPVKQAFLTEYYRIETRGAIKSKIFKVDDKINTYAEGVANVPEEVGNKLKFVPTTHTMLYINGQFLHNIGGQVVRSSKSVRLVCYYPIVSRCIDLINDRNGGIGNTTYSQSTSVAQIEPNPTVDESSRLIIANDGTIYWDGTPKQNAIVSHLGNIIMTTQRDNTKRKITAKEFMDRCWWIIGEGGGVVYQYYAAAIQNRITIKGKDGKTIGEENTPSVKARAFIKNGSGSYGTMTNTIPRIFIGEVDKWNYGKTPVGDIALVNLSKAVAQAALGNVVDGSINSWAGDDNSSQYVWDEIKEQIGTSGLKPNVPIYKREDGGFFHAFYCIFYGGDKPTRQNIESRYKTI